jgi:hypothetical protein
MRKPAQMNSAAICCHHEAPRSWVNSQKLTLIVSHKAKTRSDIKLRSPIPSAITLKDVNRAFLCDQCRTFVIPVTGEQARAKLSIKLAVVLGELVHKDRARVFLHLKLLGDLKALGVDDKEALRSLDTQSLIRSRVHANNPIFELDVSFDLRGAAADRRVHNQ